ncbi:hypothetical protein G7B40_041850 [Aetokthonos hydrillicola Thurmond2011]|jgi:hypothetical protein|uniref:Uncharacterized protein n=1 Tax=Aetokthonos hydrillicola Thurmond2011 TaxID=2712845 RepID=A0AAP5IGH0_9CYAN|nr:hypothetical protein [Aetokthonos hydrillicola]MDR9900959.1 hypothetical protein [Aetokthonos hydrillicola Thurmond2011]
MSKNKFNFLQSVAQERKPDLVQEDKIDVENNNDIEIIVDETPTNAQEKSASLEIPVKKVGRPRGKRSDPEFEQITAYIRRDTHLAVKIALLQEGQGREFSELLQELLDEFLRTQKSE